MYVGFVGLWYVFMEIGNRVKDAGWNKKYRLLEERLMSIPQHGTKDHLLHAKSGFFSCLLLTMV
jgi:hypothetical protein